jgi:hypothetical protein
MTTTKMMYSVIEADSDDSSDDVSYISLSTSVEANEDKKYCPLFLCSSKTIYRIELKMQML